MSVFAADIINPNYLGKWEGAGFKGKSYINITTSAATFKRVFLEDMKGFADSSPSIFIKSDLSGNSNMTFTINGGTLYNGVEDTATGTSFGGPKVYQATGKYNRFINIPPIEYDLVK